MGRISRQISILQITGSTSWKNPRLSCTVVQGFGDCYFSGPISSHTYSEQCLQSYSAGDLTIVSTLDGTSLAQPLISWAPQTATTYKEPLETTAEWTSELIAATWIPALVLVHKDSDIEKAKDSDDAKEAGKTEEGDKEDDDSGASRKGGVAVLAVAVGILVGAGMLLPW
ncbi:hypothetical protein MRS44_006985 [Fusarium solani]|nr:hypothetical protein MRS44_006985 [Fusarium solani]